MSGDGSGHVQDGCFCLGGGRSCLRELSVAEEVRAVGRVSRGERGLYVTWAIVCDPKQAN